VLHSFVRTLYILLVPDIFRRRRLAVKRMGGDMHGNDCRNLEEKPEEKLPLERSRDE
jgi:hypothetical protein